MSMMYFCLWCWLRVKCVYVYYVDIDVELILTLFIIFKFLDYFVTIFVNSGDFFYCHKFSIFHS